MAERRGPPTPTAKALRAVERVLAGVDALYLAQLAAGSVFRRMPQPRDPDDSGFHDVVIVQPEGDHGCPSGRAEPDDVGATVRPGKVVAPHLGARIEQGDKRARRRIPCMCARGFELVAECADTMPP